jgi:hypothetical protein
LNEIIYVPAPVVQEMTSAAKLNKNKKEIDADLILAGEMLETEKMRAF